MSIKVMEISIREKDDKFPKDDDKAEIIMLDLEVWLGQLPHQEVLEVITNIR